MNNVIKRVSAFVMAFTLLGTGTVITKNILPESDTTIVADAASKFTPPYGAYEPAMWVNYNVGSNGSGVRWLQAALNFTGMIYPSAPLSVDGSYGYLTKAAVKNFQINFNSKNYGQFSWEGTPISSEIAEDGIFGPETHRALKCIINKREHPENWY